MCHILVLKIQMPWLHTLANLVFGRYWKQLIKVQICSPKIISHSIHCRARVLTISNLFQNSEINICKQDEVSSLRTDRKLTVLNLRNGNIYSHAVTFCTVMLQPKNCCSQTSVKACKHKICMNFGRMSTLQSSFAFLPQCKYFLS